MTNYVRQIFSDVWDSSKHALKVNVVAGGGGGGGSGVNFMTGADPLTTNSGVGSTGTTLNASSGPVQNFSLQCVKTGAVTSYTVVLEASLNNLNWQTLLTATDVSDGQVFFTGSLKSPALYFRSRCTAISLGAGSNVVANILGMS